MLTRMATRARWSLIIPALIFAPLTAPVVSAAAQDATSAYFTFLDNYERQVLCPSGTNREGC